jgi:hypothetical protein
VSIAAARSRGPLSTAAASPMPKMEKEWCMAASDALTSMIAEWRQLDLEANALHAAGKRPAGSAAQRRACTLLRNIGDLPAASSADIMLKLRICDEAFISGRGFEDYLEASATICAFLWQTFIDLRGLNEARPK